MTQHEITTPSKLLDEQGRLVQRGWARQPLLDCNLENAAFYRLKALQFLRLKCWDYYAIFTPDVFLAVAAGDIGYLGNAFAYLVDYDTPWMHEESPLLPLGRGIDLPRNSTAGDVVFGRGDVQLGFYLEGDTRRLKIEWPGYHQGRGLEAEIVLDCPPGHESIVMVTPIGERRFYYNRKVNSLPAGGWITYGEKRIDLDPATCLGSLDWGRGVWEYDSFWLWASASAFLPDGRRLGLNLGGGFGDLSRATENCFFLDGQIHKLGEVPFEYDPTDFMRPWRFAAPDGRLELDFVPFLDRTAKTNLGLLRSEVHQMFGRYSGRLVTDGGEVVEVRDVAGFAEEHRARW